jgi:phasin family protein
MNNEYVDMVTKFNDQVFASAARIGELNMRTFEQLATKQASIVNQCLETSAKQYEALAGAKDYKEAMVLQSELLKGCNDKFLANLRETTEMFSSLREELTEMVEEAVKYTSKSVEKASELATKKVA